ncbi:MAG: glycerol-3-phosphate acyltransferase [Dehalococcoidia bacterium]|nr:glycerol-3-phosphate acyltransferase [Dehalococcoidia bacterium]
MNTVLLVGAIIVIGYLIGSVPTANIVMHVFAKKDLRHVGTGNVTSTAVMVHAGKLPGIVSLTGEILKTFLCLAIAGLLVGDLWAYLLIMVAASVGQIWSVWLGWTGGQAQTIFITGFLVLCPVAMAVAALTFIGSLLITKRFYLSNTVFHLAAPLCLLVAWFFNPVPLGLSYHSWGYALTCALLCGIFLVRHQTDTDDVVQTEAWGGYSH